MQSTTRTMSSGESSSSSQPKQHPNPATATCPYAASLHSNNNNCNEDDETRQDSTSKATSTTTTASSSHEPRAALSLTSSCPAFQSGSCPFKDAKSAEEVRQKLLQVPPSHLEQSGEFYKVIQQMHTTINTTKNTANSNNKKGDETTTTPFHLPGGCPVQSVVGSDIQTISFTEALEGMSLSSIMARMAAKVLREEQQEQGHGDDNDDQSSGSESQEDAVASRQEASGTETAQPKVFEQQQKQQPECTVTLSESLKTGTAISHQEAENVHFVRNFAHGKIDRFLYGQLVIQLYHVYATLETLLNRHGPQHFGSCHFPLELERTAALEDDLDYWHGGTTTTTTAVLKQQQQHPISPATADYVQRLQDIAQTEPLLLLAHSYTRYLGDLSGGRILARVARKAMGLDKHDDGLAFYEFANIKSPKKFKDSFRQALDALPLNQSQMDRLVAEANVAFCLNMRLFEELDVLANVPGSSVRPLQEALKYADMTSTTTKDTNNKGKEECPFLVKQQQQQQHQQQQNSTVTTATASSAKRCPWPFIFAHDPAQGMRDWQTWLVLGLALCWMWSLVQQRMYT